MNPEDLNKERDRFRLEHVALSQRYRAASDIHSAHSVLLELEQLFRSRGQVGFLPGFFDLELGALLARRSEIYARLGDARTEALLMDEALQHFRRSALAIDGGLLTPQAIMKVIRALDAKSGVKWKQNDPAA